MKIEKIIRVLCLPGPPADEVGGLPSYAPSMGLLRSKRCGKPDFIGRCFVARALHARAVAG